MTALQARARWKVPSMSPEKRAYLELFLTSKAKLDRAITGQSGSAGSAYGGPTAPSLEQQIAESARLADFVGTPGGTETFPLSFSRIGTQQKPRASYVGTLPDCNAPVFDIRQQAWPTVGVAGDQTTRAQRKKEATSKSNKKKLTLAEDVSKARSSYNTELFEKQRGYKKTMLDRFNPSQPLPPAPDVDERGTGVSTGQPGAASSSVKTELPLLSASTIETKFEATKSKSAPPTPSASPVAAMSTEQSGAFAAYDEARHGCDMQAHFGGQSSSFDGNSAGKYCISEQNVNRLVPFAELVPTGRDESSSEEEEEDLSLQDLEDEPVGPTLADHPYLRVRSKMPQLCTTCFSTVLPVRHNLCPECDCRDSMIPKNSALAAKVA